MNNQLTEIIEGTVRTLPGDIRLVASVYDLEYAAYPNLRTEEVELEDGTVMFNGLELWLVPPSLDAKRIPLLCLNGLNEKTFQLARTINESSVENWDECSAVLDWIEEAILAFENEKYGEIDYEMMREDEAGDRAYHDSIDA